MESTFDGDRNIGFFFVFTPFQLLAAEFIVRVNRPIPQETGFRSGRLFLAGVALPRRRDEEGVDDLLETEGHRNHLASQKLPRSQPSTAVKRLFTAAMRRQLFLKQPDRLGARDSALEVEQQETYVRQPIPGQKLGCILRQCGESLQDHDFGRQEGRLGRRIPPGLVGAPERANEAWPEDLGADESEELHQRTACLQEPPTAFIQIDEAPLSEQSPVVTASQGKRGPGNEVFWVPEKGNLLSF